MGIRSWFGRRNDDAAAPVIKAPPTEQDILASLNRVNAMLAEGNAPPIITTRVVRIARTINDTLPRLRNLGLGSPEAYSVMATATDYLPEALQAYTRLPRQWADSRPVEDGKTSLMLLIDALDLLASSMDAIFDAAVRVDANALVVQGRFLQEKFGHVSSDPSTSLGLDPSTGAGGAL